jgi:hypothetical protein
VSCVVGEDVVANPPVNAGDPQVTFRYAFDRGLGFASYGSDAAVPQPYPLLGPVRVRVKAVVDFGAGAPQHPGNPYTDPGYIEGTCGE